MYLMLGALAQRPYCCKADARWRAATGMPPHPGPQLETDERELLFDHRGCYDGAWDDDTRGVLLESANVTLADKYQDNPLARQADCTFVQERESGP